MFSFEPSEEHQMFIEAARKFATKELRERAREAERDAQRARVYRAELPLPSSPLPGLDACARFVDRVVGTLWWHERFPERDLGGEVRTVTRACACSCSAVL